MKNAASRSVEDTTPGWTVYLAQNLNRPCLGGLGSETALISVDTRLPSVEVQFPDTIDLLGVAVDPGFTTLVEQGLNRLNQPILVEQGLNQLLAKKTEGNGIGGLRREVVVADCPGACSGPSDNDGHTMSPHVESHEMSVVEVPDECLRGEPDGDRDTE